MSAGGGVPRSFRLMFRDTYREIFDRRLRFNMARHWLVWRGERINSGAISELLNWTRFDRLLSRQLSLVPRIGPLLVLALMTTRMRPFGMIALLRSWFYAQIAERCHPPSRPRQGVSGQHTAGRRSVFF